MLALKTYRRSVDVSKLLDWLLFDTKRKDSFETSTLPKIETVPVGEMMYPDTVHRTRSFLDD